MKYLIIDSHEDIAWNVLTFGRDYTRSVSDTRRLEAGSRVIELSRGETLLGWQEYQSGNIALVFATLFASPRRYEKDPGFTQAYLTPVQARDRYRSQLEVYKRLSSEHADKFTLIKNKPELLTVINAWQKAPNGEVESETPIGVVLLMEGAEGILTLDELEQWWESGVRILGPAWAGNQYCGGTKEPGPLTPAGHALLGSMDEIGYILDISHMDEQSVWQSFSLYQGPMIASHSNAKSLIHSDSNRFISDEVICELISRNGVIGVVPYNHHLVWEWNYPQNKHDVKLDTVCAHIDHICQLAGDSLHVGIGSDFDGGLGMQSTPSEIDTIADLQKIVPLLESRGYNHLDIKNILSWNWFNLLHSALP